MALRNFTVCVDGIDKTGKDLLRHYVFLLSGKKYLINCRGVMTMIAYAKLYNREFKYEIVDQEHILNVLLLVEKDDWEVRCKINNEPAIDFEQNQAAFNYAYSLIEAKNLPCMTINTSLNTPYQTAKKIIQKLEEMERLERTHHDFD